MQNAWKRARVGSSVAKLCAVGVHRERVKASTELDDFLSVAICYLIAVAQ